MKTRSWFGRLLDGPGVLIAALLIAGGAIAAAKATGPSGSETTAELGSGARGLPSSQVCRDVRLKPGSTCRTKTALLTITDESKPLLLDPLQARVMRTDTEATGKSSAQALVRLRIRNAGRRAVTLTPSDGALYLIIGERRLIPQEITANGSTKRSLRLPPDTVVTSTASFPLSAAETSNLGGKARSAQLGVRPGRTTEGGLQRVGIIRMTLPRIAQSPASSTTTTQTTP